MGRGEREWQTRAAGGRKVAGGESGRASGVGNSKKRGEGDAAVAGDTEAKNEGQQWGKTKRRMEGENGCPCKKCGGKNDETRRRRKNKVGKVNKKCMSVQCSKEGG